MKGLSQTIPLPQISEILEFKKLPSLLPLIWAFPPSPSHDPFSFSMHPISVSQTSVSHNQDRQRVNLYLPDTETPSQGT